MMKRWSSIIKNELFLYFLEVEDYKESLSSNFLEVEDDKELKGPSFSIVGHKHGTRLYSQFESIIPVLLLAIIVNF